MTRSHPTTPLKAVGVDRRAVDLLITLEDAPGSREEICERLGWTKSAFNSAVAAARERVCPQLGVTIPHPIPDDGWVYRVTGEWLSDDGSAAIADGTTYAINQIETRLAAILRDVEIAAGNLDSRSVPGRRCNFLRKHLTHLLGTLAEIGPNPVREATEGMDL